MAWRLAYLKIAVAEGDDIVLHQISVGAFGTTVRRERAPAPGPLLQQPSSCYMVGVDMGFQDVDEAQAELFDQRRVAAHLLEHRVDDDRRSATAVGEQVGVGRGRRIEQLPE